MLANSVHIKEWFNSFINVIIFYKTHQWFKVMFISLSYIFPLLLLLTLSSHNLSKPKILCVASRLFQIYKIWSWHPSQLVAVFSSVGRHNAYELWLMMHKIYVPQKLCILRLSSTGVHKQKMFLPCTPMEAISWAWLQSSMLFFICVVLHAFKTTWFQWFSSNVLST